jgi:hypothetical protein
LDHENSSEQETTYLMWKDFEQGLREEGCIDDGLQKVIIRRGNIETYT